MSSNSSLKIVGIIMLSFLHTSFFVLQNKDLKQRFSISGEK